MNNVKYIYIRVVLKFDIILNGRHSVRNIDKKDFFCIFKFLGKISKSDEQLNVYLKACLVGTILIAKRQCLSDVIFKIILFHY